MSATVCLSFVQVAMHSRRCDGTHTPPQRRTGERTGRRSLRPARAHVLADAPPDKGHRQGHQADAGHGRIVAVLNMADDEALLAAARDVAAAIRQCGARHPVAITAMLADDPLRDFLD